MVVIDVLRWSTVVATALANGARAVEAVASPDEARERAGALGAPHALLGGERGNVALPGFDLGNSPLEYARERVTGRVVITTTTNGTQALAVAREAQHVWVGAFVNLDALVERLSALERTMPLTLLCAGQAGVEALEDTACAGAIISRLGGLPTGPASALHALRVWERHGANAPRALQGAPHAAALERAGFAADVHYAATAKVGVVPALKTEGDVLRLVPA